MNLYKISQKENSDYDTYDSAVVAAPDEKTARGMSPITGKKITIKEWKNRYSSWCSKPDFVTVEFLGTAKRGTKKGVVCSSFNAG